MRSTKTPAGAPKSKAGRLKQMIARPTSVVEPVTSAISTRRAKFEALRMVMEINCASHRSRKFLFLRRVRNPPDGVATFMKQSPQVTMLVYLYRYPSHARAPAWYAVRPLLLVIISAVHISRNANQYQLPGARPANHSFRMDVAYAGVTDHLYQDALALGSCV